nr:MAG TPA: hypothetical protein [Caudoviricetes sp.]
MYQKRYKKANRSIEKLGRGGISYLKNRVKSLQDRPFTE